MTVALAATVGRMTSPQPRVPRPWRAIEAVSTLATWMSFAVVAWLVLVAGAGLGAAAAWLGPVGALWVVATAFALCAALVVLATAPVPATRVVDAISAPTVELAAVPPAPAGPSGLRRWLFGWRLALILLLPAFAAQAAGVALVPVWTDGKPGTSGVLGGAFVVGAVAGAVLLRAPGVHP